MPETLMTPIHHVRYKLYLSMWPISSLQLTLETHWYRFHTVLLLYQYPVYNWITLGLLPYLVTSCLVSKAFLLVSSLMLSCSQRWSFSILDFHSIISLLIVLQGKYQVVLTFILPIRNYLKIPLSLIPKLDLLQINCEHTPK